VPVRRDSKLATRSGMQEDGRRPWRLSRSRLRLFPLSAEQLCSHATFRHLTKQASELSGTRRLRDMLLVCQLSFTGEAPLDETSASVMFRLQEQGASPQTDTSNNSLLPHRWWEGTGLRTCLARNKALVCSGLQVSTIPITGATLSMPQVC
jgi:hypothetical protein